MLRRRKKPSVEVSGFYRENHTQNQGAELEKEKEFSTPVSIDFSPNIAIYYTWLAQRIFSVNIEINAERARIFRLTHISNLPWILNQGLHCKNSGNCDPNFKQIGHPELIDKRTAWPVPIPPSGTLGDFVPFYFTPFSMMLYNIHTGYGGINKIENKDLVFLVTSIHRLESQKKSFVFTDRHALLRTASFYNSSSKLDCLDWSIWQSRDFRRDPDDPEKTERYQAEALIHQYLSPNDIAGIVCFSENERGTIVRLIRESGTNIPCEARQGWYFR